jgi:hypothetical protein
LPVAPALALRLRELLGDGLLHARTARQRVIDPVHLVSALHAQSLGHARRLLQICATIRAITATAPALASLFKRKFPYHQDASL